MHVVMEVFLCKVLTLLPQDFPAFGIYGRKVTIRLIVSSHSLHSVDVVFVLDHERLFHDLQRELPRSTQIVPLPKSGGVSYMYMYM